jgi:hypothetical protein
LPTCFSVCQLKASEEPQPEKGQGKPVLFILVALSYVLLMYSLVFITMMIIYTKRACVDSYV